MSTRQIPSGQAQGAAALVLLRTTEALTVVLTKETEALAAHDGAAVRSLFGEKAECLAAYERAVAAFAETDPKTATVDGGLARTLKSASDRLRAASEQNRRRLEVARAGQRRLIELIVDAAKTVAAGPGIYARSGAVARPAVRRAPPPPALSLNLAF
jgi:hypothetical protein